MMITRRIKSKLVPGGKKYASTTFATNKRVISGTPRINSINTTHIPLIMGMFDCLPKANSIPIGRDRDTQTVPKIIFNMKPPISLLGTASRAIKSSKVLLSGPPKDQTRIAVTSAAKRPTAKLKRLSTCTKT